MYRAAAANLLARGVDGLTIFNMDYTLPARRAELPQVLRRITDPDYLATTARHYTVYPNRNISAPTFPAKDAASLALVIADAARLPKSGRAVLRVETEQDSAGLRIEVRLNGQPLEPCEHDDTELFPPLERNAFFPTRERLRFFTVPLERLRGSPNRIEVVNLDKAAASCSFYSLELALYP